jgi:predicted SAM-dependent methyltransferase
MRELLTVAYDLYVQPLRGGWRIRAALRRRHSPLIPASVYAGRKLNLGSSHRLLPGYLNIDGDRDRKPDIVCDVSAVPLRDADFDLVRASHILEHFTLGEATAAMAEWRRVLKPGGYLVVCCPDYIRLSWRALLGRRYFNPAAKGYRRDVHNDWIDGLFANDVLPAYRHKAAFTEAGLRAVLIAAGFRIVGRQAYEVEEPATLGISDDSCTEYSINLVGQKVGAHPISSL